MTKRKVNDHINAELTSLMVSVDDLHEDEANARMHDDRNIKAIADSLSRFGQQKPIVASEDGSVIAGNGTLRAARSLGWKKIAVVRWHGPETDAKAYAVADNRTAELAMWDADMLAATLKHFESYDADLRSLLAFSEAELAALASFTTGETVGNDKREAARGDVLFKILVDCMSESHQAELLTELTDRGLSCKPILG